ncbi:MAG: nitrogen regulation protein NR(I) [Rhodobacteraceae bacterium]|nr:MAG: nitrogen regulation protein NR(I) [Paracoccaceae bacterium]
MEGTVIVADDDKSIRTVLAQALTRAGCKVRATGTLSTLWRWLDDGEGDVLVTDVMMPDGDALDILPVLKRKRPKLPIIVMSAQNTVMTAIRANEAGAYEYLPKPFDLKGLLQSVSKALKNQALSNIKKTSVEISPSVSSNQSTLPLIGRSAVMQDVYRIMARLMGTDLGVLISGSSGTGKELVATALHEFGQRKEKPFVKVNIATVPEDLVEVELFGKEPSIDLDVDVVGKFEQAEGGTIFLDEVSDLSLVAQSRLLSILQTGEFTRVGGHKTIKTDVRILASTNQDLRELINEGNFREDLFYRLNVVPIKLPNLNQRIEDISDLVHHFLSLAETKGLGLKLIAPDAIELLKKQHWPGNVRELKNFVNRMVVLSKDQLISSTDIKEELKEKLSGFESSYKDDNKTEQFSLVVENHLKRYFDLHGNNLPPPGLYDRVIKEIELPLIALSLASTRGNQLKASELLGINRNTLRKKIKGLDINVSRGKKMM